MKKLSTQMKKGYFGIGIYMGKNTLNLGTLWRSAHNFHADFIFLIGKRFKQQPSDTTKAYRNIPLYQYDTYEDFCKNIPYSCQVVCVEQNQSSKDIREYKHPKNCIYLLGAEDTGIPDKICKGKEVVHISTPMCVNVAVAGSIVMYDRLSKIKGVDF